MDTVSPLRLSKETTVFSEVKKERKEVVIGKMRQDLVLIHFFPQKCYLGKTRFFLKVV